MTKWNPTVVPTPKDIRPDFEFDLKGEVCPYTFVKSKLALEMLQANQILQVVVDNDESATNVPKSMTNEGHTVLGVEKINARDWLLTIKKSR
ncbi:MAG: sulfurtransferase TusA family protein [Chloroflexota bacterium]|nr:sulfurtransferase TusA family protein [Chloroflexota bacterium]